MELVQSKEELLKRVEYIATQTAELARTIVGETYPISSLTVFAYSESEFEFLTQLLAEIGVPYNYNNGPRVMLHDPVVVGDNKITHLRVRKPDTQRPQVGCNDFDTEYQVFKSKYLEKYSSYLRLIRRPEYEMIELHDPHFDVLAYIVSI